MVIGDVVVKETLTCVAGGQDWSWKYSTICECCVCQAWTRKSVGVSREQALRRKYSTISECSGNFLNIMISGDPVVKETLSVCVAGEQDW